VPAPTGKNNGGVYDPAGVYCFLVSELFFVGFLHFVVFCGVFRNPMHVLGLVTMFDHPAVISARVSGSATTRTVNSRSVSRSAITRLLFRQSQAL